jgi:aryl-alcohol dehydrogenase-like predicted oxidoreductase
MSLSSAYGPSEDEEGLAAIERALDLGINFLDTAEAYGDGHNERLAARVLAQGRERVVMATKWGIGMERGRMVARGRPEQARRAIEGSLARLGTDYVDLYYLHRRDPDVPIEESVGAMGRLVEEGKVRHLGLSGVSSGTLRRAHAEHPIAALQSEYSIFARQAEGTSLDCCAELGIHFVAYSPLGRGFLTGSLRSPDDFDDHDLRRVSPRLQADNFDHNLERVDALVAYAEQIEMEPGQLALAWVRAKGALPLFGTRRAARIESNARAAEIQLGEDVLTHIDELVPSGSIRGDSLPEALDHLTEHEPEAEEAPG